MISIILLFFCTSLWSQESQYCGLDKALYYATACIVRTDFLVLCKRNAAWLLKKKIELQDHADDFDRYYLRRIIDLNHKRFYIYYTPLHEAIDQGNLGCVKILSRQGACPTKKIIINEDNPLQEDVAQEFYGRYFLPISECVEPWALASKIQKIKEYNLSAMQLAYKLQREPIACEIVQRKAIFDYLQHRE